MTKWLYEIRSMGVFLICAQMLIHFRPKSSYTKYLRLMVSLILLAQFVEPIGRAAGIFEKGELQSLMQKMEWSLEMSGYEELDSYIDEGKLLESLLEELHISEYEDAMQGEKE